MTYRDHRDAVELLSRRWHSRDPGPLTAEELDAITALSERFEDGDDRGGGLLAYQVPALLAEIERLKAAPLVRSA